MIRCPSTGFLDIAICEGLFSKSFYNWRNEGNNFNNDYNCLKHNTKTCLIFHNYNENPQHAVAWKSLWHYLKPLILLPAYALLSINTYIFNDIHRWTCKYIAKIKQLNNSSRYQRNLPGEQCCCIFGEVCLFSIANMIAFQFSSYPIKVSHI